MLHRNISSKIATLSAATLLLLAASGFAQDNLDNDGSRAEREGRLERFEGDARDAWIDGKAETVLALSEHVSALDIETEVEDGVVTLFGTVDSEINKKLAAELVTGLSGVESVENNLEVSMNTNQNINRDRDANRDTDQRSERNLEEVSDADDMMDDDDGLLAWFDRVSTTAEVKTRLIANSEISGMQIDVDTEQDSILLSGVVDSDSARSLAQQIAEEASEGRSVINELFVSNQ